MSWSITVGRVRETVIRIHLTLLGLMAWFAWQGWRQGGLAGAAEELAFVALLFLSVLLHEFGHIAAARRYGIPTPDVLLTPIGGMARIARMPRNPREELVIALAGPGVTLLIIVLLGALVLLLEGAAGLQLAWPTEVPVWTAIWYTNVVLLVFNLIPAFPMDGGRVLRALLAMRLGLVRGTGIAARVGQVLAVAMGILGWQYNVFLVLIAVFVFLAAGMEYEQVRTAALAGDLTASRLTVTDLRAFNPQTAIAQAIAILTRSDQRCFPVLDEDNHLLGIITRDDLLRGVDSAGLHAPVTMAMATPEATGTIATTLPFEEAVARLMQSNRDALPVLDESGRFAGLITRDNVTDVLLVRQMRQALEARG